MKERVDEMRAGGIHTEQFAIRHVRKPGERMPIGRVEGGERPFDSGTRQAALDHIILRHIIAVIVKDEAIAHRRPINRQRDQREQQSNEPRTRHWLSLYEGYGAVEFIFLSR